MFDRPSGNEKAVLVHLELDGDAVWEDPAEFQELVVSAGAEPVALITGNRRVPDPKYFLGTGKAEEVGLAVEATGAGVVLVNHALSPAQERNLEALLKCRVLDRIGLILDIFARRARTHEGKLQVELAQLRHLSTRLVRGWTHLERQRGGIGLRGPGETQLETDRRLIGERIKQLHRRLDEVRRTRRQGRRARQRAGTPTVSLVGYTNAGKSTLFNRLTGAEVYAADQLFATLDPTLRRVELPVGGGVVMADTVGFIRHLPHELVAAFHSTLEESREASLLLHVIDASAPDRDSQVEQVQQVLAEIGADQVPQVEVYNKIDRLADSSPRREYGEHGKVRRVWLSAATGVGLDYLREALGDYLRNPRRHCTLSLGVDQGRLRARLYALGIVVAERLQEQGGWQMDIEAEEVILEQLQHRDGFDLPLVEDLSPTCLAGTVGAP